MTKANNTLPLMTAAIAAAGGSNEEHGGAVDGTAIEGGWETIEGSGGRDMPGNRERRPYDPTEPDLLVLFSQEETIDDGDSAVLELSPEGQMFIAEKIVFLVSGDSHDEISVIKATVGGLQFFGSSQMPGNVTPFQHTSLGNEFRSPPITSKKPAKLEVQNNNGGGTARTVQLVAYGKGNRAGGD